MKILVLNCGSSSLKYQLINMETEEVLASGKYERIGKLVFVDFYVRGKITKLNGTENYAVIEGLPFVSRDKYFGQQSLNVALVYSLLEDNLNVAFIPQDRKIRIQALESSAKKLKITNTNYFEIAGSGWYETDD